MAYHIATLLEKMGSSDKDYRFMALNDLMNELNRDAIKLDDDSERKVIRSLLRLLEDKNGEIQNQAVKCLGALVPRVKDVVVELCVDSLCTGVTAEREELRDISCMALKTVIGELPHGDAQQQQQAPTPQAQQQQQHQGVTANVCKRVTPRLLDALQLNQAGGGGAQPAANAKPLDVAIRIELLDVLADLLVKYPKHIVMYHAQIEECLGPELRNARWAVRKRAMHALAQLTAVAAPVLFAKAIDSLVASLLEEGAGADALRTYISALAACSRAAGAADGRFGAYLQQVVPILLEYSDASNASVHVGGDVNDELVEACLHAFEAFCARCPKDSAPFVPAIVSRCRHYLGYDPNYQYDERDAIRMEIDTGGGECDNMENGDAVSANEEDCGDDGDEEEENEYSDDDDVSWKVRRAAARCIEAVVLSSREQLPALYADVAPLLVSRMIEREDNVRVDIVKALMALLNHTRLMLPSASAQAKSVTMETAAPSADSAVAGLSDEQRRILLSLNSLIRPLVSGARRQLCDRRCVNTRTYSLQLLALACTVVPNAYQGGVMAKLLSSVSSALSQRGTNSSMKIDSLRLVHSILIHHTPEALSPCRAQLVSLVVPYVADQFYKVSAEALHALASLIAVLAKVDATAAPTGGTGDSGQTADLVRTIYAAVADKLRATDIDQEVKEKAITCTALLLSHLGHVGALPQADVDQCVRILLERMRNEMTRLTAVRAVHILATRGSVPLDGILSECVLVLAEFMRKNNRPLRMATLNLLLALVDRHAGKMDDKLLAAVVTEAPALIGDADLQISQLMLTLLQKVASLRPAIVWASSGPLVAECGRLSQSALLHGGTLRALCAFFHCLVPAAAGTGGQAASEEAAMGLVQTVAAPALSAGGGAPAFCRNVLVNMGRVCAHCVHAAGDQCARHWGKRLVDTLQESRCGEQQMCFALLSLGELGRKCPQSLAAGVDSIIVNLMQHNGEEVKSAASVALGALAAGDLRAHLPLLLKEIERSHKLQYLLLHSLKEVICSDSAGGGSGDADARSIGDSLGPYLDSIWSSLWKHASCSEEGTRNVVSECLGKLASCRPDTLVPELRDRLQRAAGADGARVRATCVTAVKFVLTEQPAGADNALMSCMPAFLACLDDDDINVRRATLVMFNSAAHNKPALVSSMLAEALPALYAETEVKKELVREVEMGPFKHTIDDGLDTRKAAYECMYTLLEACAPHLDVHEFCERLEQGLRDQHDIRLLCYAMLARLAASWPAQVHARLDRLLEPLRAALTARPKTNSVKQEQEKLDELRRAACRAVGALVLRLGADVERHAQLCEVLSVIRASPELKAVLESALVDPRRDWAGMSGSLSHPAGFEHHHVSA